MSEEKHARARFLGSIRGMAALAWEAEELFPVPGEAAPGSAVFRHLVLEEWLWELTARREEISLPAFSRWLDDLSDEVPRDEPAVRELRRRAQREAREWLARSPGLGGGGVLAGATPFLEIAAACSSWEIPRTYRFFNAFSELGPSEGGERATVGLLAVLLAQAVRDDPYRAGFAAWFFNTAGRCLRTLRRSVQRSGEGDLLRLDEIEDRIVQGYEGGRRGEAPSSGIPALWERLAFALSSSGRELRKIFEALDPRQPADRLAGHLVSLMAGAWYGQDALEEAWGPGVREAEIHLWRELGINPGLRAEMFYELSQLLHGVSPADAEASA